MKIQSTLTVGLMQALPLLLTLGVSSPTLEYLVLGCIGLTTVIGLVMILMTPMEKDEGMQVCELLFECFILYTQHAWSVISKVDTNLFFQSEIMHACMWFYKFIKYNGCFVTHYKFFLKSKYIKRIIKFLLNSDYQ